MKFETFWQWSEVEWHAFFSVLDIMADLGIGKSPEERAQYITGKLPHDFDRHDTE